MKRKSLAIIVKKKFPYIVSVGFKEQWDLEKQPWFCIFYKQENRTDRIYEF